MYSYSSEEASFFLEYYGEDGPDSGFLCFLEGVNIDDQGIPEGFNVSMCPEYDGQFFPIRINGEMYQIQGPGGKWYESMDYNEWSDSF